MDLTKPVSALQKQVSVLERAVMLLSRILRESNPHVEGQISTMLAAFASNVEGDEERMKDLAELGRVLGARN